VGINLNVNDKGLRIYQGRDFGEAFYVVITDLQGKEYKNIFEMGASIKKGQAKLQELYTGGYPVSSENQIFC